jgi:GGDEF domain-containing protein
MGIDDLWLDDGPGLRDGFMIHAAAVIRSCLEEVDVVGALDNGEFGIILNLYQEEAVTQKAQELIELLIRSPFEVGENEHRINPIWGAQEIFADSSPDQIILAANSDARNK